MILAGANLLDAFYCLSREVEEPPPRFCFLRPAVCLVECGDWLLNAEAEEEHVGILEPPEELWDAFAWIMETLSQAVRPDVCMIDQVRITA